MTGFYVLIGIAIGAMLTAIGYGVKSRGNLVVDTTDPESAYIFLEIEKGDVRQIMNSKYVVLKTSIRN